MNHYDVLGVGPSADEVALHQAYVDLARRHHPDLVGGDPARMQAINQAWATLGDPVRRADYDRTLRAGVTTGVAQPRPAPPASDDTVDDLDDDNPIRVTVALPRWLSLLPVAMFAVAVLAFAFGLMSSSQPLLGLAMMALILSCLFFLAAPFVALFASRRPNR